MQTARRFLSITLALATVLTILPFVSPRVARAANNAIQNVFVTNTSSNPVPTSAVGTTTVAGSVSLNGTPNFNLVNTPNVNVANTPSVNVSNTPTVNVATMPALSGSVSLASGSSVQDADAPGREPFQATVPLNWFGTQVAYLPIPSGKRLIVDYVAISGAAGSSAGNIQPIVILASSVAGSPAANFYIQPIPSTLVPGQYYENGPVKVYADSLAVEVGFAGYAPDFLVLNVVVSGHLITP